MAFTQAFTAPYTNNNRQDHQEKQRLNINESLGVAGVLAGYRFGSSEIFAGKTGPVNCP